MELIMEKWGKRIDGIIKQEDILEANMRMPLSLIYGKCTEVICVRIDPRYLICI